MKCPSCDGRAKVGRAPAGDGAAVESWDGQAPGGRPHTCHLKQQPARVAQLQSCGRSVGYNITSPNVVSRCRMWAQLGAPPFAPPPPTPLRPLLPRWAHAPHGRGPSSHCGLRCCWTTSRSLALVEMPFVRRPCECEACPGRGQRRSGVPGQVAPGGAALHLPFKIKTLPASLNHTQCHVHSIRVNREGVRARYAHQTNVRMHMYI